MGSQVPLLNDYKQVFFWKRFTQTLLGGPKLRLGYDAPVYVYINQVILFIVPLILGGFITLLVELLVVKSYIGVYLYGTCMLIYVLSAQCVSLFAQKRSSSAVARLNVQNVLAEEDEVEFESCFDGETLKFVLPTKKWKLNIIVHALISGVMCGLGLWFLLPSTLHSLFGNVGATVILFIFGWLTMCIAQYPLTATGPPESATYRTTDTYEVMPLLRAFYVLLLLAVDLAWRFYQTELFVINQALHIVFIFLPLLWISGILPPLDALWVWMGEQVLVKALGGSYMASDIRLILMLVFSCLEVIVAYFLPSSVAVAVFCACFGYILSLDISTCCNQVLHFCYKQIQKGKTNKNHSNSRNQLQTSSYKGLGWQWGWTEFLAHFVMLIVIGGISGVCSHFSDSTDDVLKQALGYSIVALLVVGEIIIMMQSVYIFGLWRNPLFPCNVQTPDVYSKKKRLLHRLGYVWRLLMNFVAPYVMLAYVSLFNTTAVMPSFLYAMGSVRAWRRIWQCSSRSLLELSIVHIINATQIGPSWWASATLGIQLMTVGFIWDRILQFLQKIYAHIVILITSYTVEKQRRSSTVPMIVALVCLYPFILAILAIASVLSAPLLPLFTLPIVLIGFPRSMRFWPEPVGASANVCDDSIYYEQLAPKLTIALRRAMADGSLGTIYPGQYYLLRFQDRMVWLQVLEVGFGYCTLSIKGMELQETSCHTVEATELDGIFETTFEYERKFKCCSVNKYPLHSLVPVDAFPVHTYSDARNVLTGIIDSPDTLKLMDQCFLKTLIWVMLHHNSSRTRDGSVSSSSPNKGKTNESPPEERTNSRTGLVAQAPPYRDDTQDSGRPLSVQSTENVEDVRPVSETKSRTTSWGSLKSWNDDDDDDNDSLDLDFSSNKKKGVNLNMRTNKNFSAKSKVVESPALPGAMPDLDDDVDDLMNEFDFGLPAIDAGLKKNSKVLQTEVPMNTFHKPMIGIKLAGSMQFSSPHSSKLSLPLKWREIPLEPGKVNPYLGRFPKDWYLHVLKKLDLAHGDQSGEQIALEIAEDDALTNMYSYLVLACYVVANVLNRSGQDESLSPGHVYKVYTGEIPWSTSLEWLNEDPELMALVVKAFRLAFKLAYDQAVLGEASDLDELSDYLEEYETDWYMGSEKDAEWTQAIKQEKTQLFSLIHDQAEGVYKGRVMTKQPVMAYIGKLNAEVVRALWASISLELLYFTNDDEERYSIQAHPVILRNLTVQAADPPLGYPIYASPPVSVPTF